MPSLTWIWPSALWLQLLLPLAVAFYLWLRARRRAAARAYANLQTVGADGSPLPRSASRWRAALPAVLLLAALSTLLFAIARPQAAMTLPSRIDTVVLALDISGSMRANDVEPTRLAAAQAAAKSFVEHQPKGVRIGVVAIAASAAVVQSPTTDRQEIKRAIDRLSTQRGTALGSGLVIALDSAVPSAKIDVEGFINPRKNVAAVVDRPKSVEPPAGGSAAIVLLSDGESNVGPPLAKAAELAAQHGVRVYTVGLGKPEGVVINVDGWSARVRLSEEVLKQVAVNTQGEYFPAASASDLKRVYNTLSTRIAFEKQRPTEITALVAALGALLATLGAGLSIVWFNRIL